MHGSDNQVRIATPSSRCSPQLRQETEDELHEERIAAYWLMFLRAPLLLSDFLAFVAQQSAHVL
jgi:hypothetical protein